MKLLRILRALTQVGVLGGIGDIISSAMTMKIMREQQDFVKKQRRTAYQDTMEDMRKAGLNPILAYQKGPTIGTGTPSVSTPQFGAMGAMERMAPAAMAAVAKTSEAQSAKRLRAQQEVTERQRGIMYLYQANSAEASRNLTNTQNELMRMKIPAGLTSMEFDQSETGKGAIRINRGLGRGEGVRAVNSARGILR